MSEFLSRNTRAIRRGAGFALITAFAAATFIAVPVTFDGSDLSSATALAGKGNGKDNGRGGGQGRGGGNGKGNGKANQASSATGPTKARLPGSLNAANAAPRALDRANPRSRVGALGAYMDAMADYVDAVARDDLEAQEAALDAAAAALADAANKDIEIDAGVVDSLNRALDGKRDGFDHTGEPGDPIHEAESEIADRINPPPS
ncbi:MAG: hypothetical protein JSU82_16725 [Rhodospirillales bacterium]|nr:MAG: hypothetical protein JSU82_16725 [Rhodospirillales bacterium]